MKSKRILVLLTGATMGVTGAGFQTVACAQTAITPPAPMAEQTKPQMIRVRNVPASLMAWWLDPSRNTPPVQISNGRENAKLFPEIPAPTALPLGVKVPVISAGVERIVAIDPQNTLLVYGSKEGVQELQKTVEMLDIPLRQIEIEAKFVQIAEADVAALQIDFGAAQPEKPNVGFARANIEPILAALIAQNKAKMITAPRVLAIDNLPAVLSNTISTPVVVGVREDNGEFRELLNPQEKQFPLLLTSAFQFGVMPTLNADDTMTLRLASWRPVQLNNGNTKERINLGDSDQTQIVFNVRDGLTVGFKGVDNRLFNLWAKDKAPAPNVVVLVTARIVRRADDKVKTVALQR